MCEVGSSVHPEAGLDSQSEGMNLAHTVMWSNSVLNYEDIIKNNFSLTTFGDLDQYHNALVNDYQSDFKDAKHAHKSVL